MKRCHFLLKSIIRAILLSAFKLIFYFKLVVKEKLRTSLWNIFLTEIELGSVYCTERMHILIMLARFSLVGWGFSWQDHCYRGSQIISSFLITICWKNRIHVSAAADGENSQTEPWTLFCASAFLKPFIYILCCICCDAFSTVWFSYRLYYLPWAACRQTTI